MEDGEPAAPWIIEFYEAADETQPGETFFFGGEVEVDVEQHLRAWIETIAEDAESYPLGGVWRRMEGAEPECYEMRRLIRGWLYHVFVYLDAEPRPVQGMHCRRFVLLGGQMEQVHTHLEQGDSRVATRAASDYLQTKRVSPAG